MPRSRIEIYWKTPETAPDGVIAQVRVTDDSGSDYLLPYPCELTEDGWVNAASGKPLAVRVTYWKPYVETLPRRKPGKRIGSDQDQQNGEGPRPYMQPTNLKAIAREAALRGDTKTLFHALDLLERLTPIATFMDFCTELEELRRGARNEPSNDR